MSAERRQRLDAIGFVWDPREGMGRRLCSANDFQNARGSLSRAKRMSKAPSSLGHGSGDSALTETPCPLNESSV